MILRSIRWTRRESRDLYEILLERHRAGSIIVTSNRGPDEWLVTFADPIRAIIILTTRLHQLVLEPSKVTVPISIKIAAVHHLTGPKEKVTYPCADRKPLVQREHV
jgi:hypothetical protein